MSNQPWDRSVINLRERPISADTDLIGSYSAATISNLVANLFSRWQANFPAAAAPMVPVGAARFLGSGFRVVFGVGMQVLVESGLGFFNDNTTTSAIGGVTGVNDLSIFKPLSLTTTEAIAVPASDPGNPRIDIVEVKIDRRLQDPTTRDVLNPGTGIFAPATVNKTLSYNQNGRSSVNGSGSINYKTGTPAGVPVAPATTAGYVKIAEVRVGAAAVAVAGNDIKDLRGLLFIGNRLSISGLVQQNAGPPHALVALEAPSGIDATFVVGRTNAAQMEVFIKAGDGALYNNLSGHVTYFSDRTIPRIVVPGNFVAEQITVDAVLQGILFSGATSFPSMYVAVGQVLLRLSWRSVLANTNGELAIADRAHFTANIGY